MRRLYLLFFVSGFPALLYQVAWQRSLFLIYGINVESVTMVVTAFLMGLGLGSLAGGWLSARPGVRRLVAFGAIEVAVGLFGVVSLEAFEAVGAVTAGHDAWTTGAATFLLVLLPTLGMGATLPILCAFLVERSGNVGRAVGMLYFVNTLGSAAACFAAGLVLFGWLGLAGTVHLAAAINLLLGAGILAVARRERRRPAPDPEATPGAGGAIGYRAALALSAGAGFIALSYEIVWYRVFSYASGGSARAFPLLLGAYLLGLAGGSLGSRRLCTGGLSRRPDVQRAAAGGLVLGATLLGFLVAPLLSWLVVGVPHYGAGLWLVVLAAGALGAVFPLLSHLAVAPTAGVGRRLAGLYLANIVGSALGSFLTGFVLLDAVTLPVLHAGLGVAGAGLAAGLLAQGPPARRRRLLAAAGAGAAACALGAVGLFGGLYERLHYRGTYTGQRYADLVETRSGVVAVTREGIVYGGGLYDGRFKTTFADFADDLNLVYRTYALSAFLDAPREILVIGLGSGSWTKIVASHPAAPRVTVVEINPGYLAAIARAPEMAPLLDDPRVEVVVDDGRRWLRAHPDRRFDAIVANVTFNWRAHASALLSQEFLAQVRAHLAPGGVYYYNTTWNPRVQRTGALAFPHAVRVGSFLAASERPLEIDRARWRETMGAWRIDGAPALGPSAQAALLGLFEEDGPQPRRPTPYNSEGRDALLARTAGLEPVTDDNMGTEWDWVREDGPPAR